MPDAPDPKPACSPGMIPPAGSNPSLHEMLLDNLFDGVYFVDTERRITYWNKGAERLTGYSPEEAVGMYCFDNFLSHVNDQGCSLCLNGCPLAASIADGQRRQAEIYLRHKLGHRVPVSVRAAPIHDAEGRIIGAVEVFSDVSAKKDIERRAVELENLAFCDGLTGIPNRRYVELKVKQALQEVEEFGRSAGLIMMDVDHFKEVNDAHGHVAGDATLKAVSKTVELNRRPGDIVGRWGGEEFLAIVMDVNPTVLTSIAERYRKLIAESAVPAGEDRIQITVSLGATLLVKGDSDQSAIHRADGLMYKSKMAGRNRTTLG